MMNVSQKYVLEVRKASPILGFISNIIDSRSKEVIISLYLALVRPDLQYVSSLGSPVQDTDILGESGGGPLIEAGDWSTCHTQTELSLFSL